MISPRPLPSPKVNIDKQTKIKAIIGNIQQNLNSSKVKTLGEVIHETQEQLYQENMNRINEKIKKEQNKARFSQLTVKSSVGTHRQTITPSPIGRFSRIENLRRDTRKFQRGTLNGQIFELSMEDRKLATPLTPISSEKGSSKGMNMLLTFTSID